MVCSSDGCFEALMKNPLMYWMSQSIPMDGGCFGKYKKI
jgi:hypothetical protein